MFAFSVRCLKHHLPLIDDIVTVYLLAKVPGNFARIKGNKMEWFRVFVDVMMKSPLEIAWTLPKFDRVIGIWVEEIPQLPENCCRVKLERMGITVKYFSCSVDGVHYNNDLRDDFIGVGLIDATPDGKKFCLYACHKQSMVHYLGEQAIHYVYMQYRCGDIFLDASICYNESYMRWRRVTKNYVIEFLSANFVFFFFFFIN